VWSDLGFWYVLSRSAGAFLLDPDSGALERAEWLDPVTADFGPRLSDGRFFAPLREGGVGLVDPRRRTVTPVLAGRRVESVTRAGTGGIMPFKECEPVLVRAGSDIYHFERDAETLRHVPFLSPPNVPVQSTRDGSLFVVTNFFGFAGGRAGRPELVRYDLATGAVTPLFPRQR
jgi:hypothetical protein